MNPYGVCHHTKYEGCGPCIHDAWNEGRDAGFTEGMKWRMGSDAAWQYWFNEGLAAAREAVAALPYGSPLDDALAAIDALKGDTDGP